MLTLGGSGGNMTQRGEPLVDTSRPDALESAGSELAVLARTAPPSREPAVSLEGVRKSFGEVVAVDSLDLEIADGEFFSMLGPSGSGKTTTLRLIAGFERPSAGTIRLLGRDVSDLAPFDRDVNTVFQDYALFPHMDVAENVAYGLMVHGVARRERTARVDEALQAMRLDGFQRRRPAQLSGGQRQRVALARALVNRPRVLLLDEPLGALDRRLREDMQVELKAIQQQVGITFVFVTHDQTEALAMSDRIAVFNAGRVEQVGTPREIYECPGTAFVAGFVGTSNVIQGELARSQMGAPGPFTVRPERLRLVPLADAPTPEQCTVIGEVRDAVYLGSETRYVVGTAAGDRLVVTQPNTAQATNAAQPGDSVRLIWQRQHALRLADDGEVRARGDDR